MEALRAHVVNGTMERIYLLLEANTFFRFWP